MFDKAIRSSRIVTPSGIKSGVLIIKDGKIIDVVDAASTETTDSLDVGDKLIMPGMIDPHVHINEPGRTNWEGFETATRAALSGGVTTLVDMPLNSSPVTITVDAFNAKLKASKNKLYTNCGFWGGVVPGYVDEIPALAEAGVLGFKAFLTHSGIDEFPNVDEDDLRQAMPLIAKYDLPLLVHCELTDDDHGGDGEPRSYANYLSSRPTRWENNAIAMMIRLCRAYKCRVHIVHLSSSESIEQIKKARQEGLPITVESAQHYLYFNAENIGNGQTQFKCAPPIREKNNNDQLWQALSDGIIDLVATDHSPSTPALKEIGSGNFMHAWGGIASIQFALTVLWTAAKQRGFKVEDVCKWLSVNPSLLLPKNMLKGKIEKGYDADIIIFDEEKEFIVEEKMIHHKHKITPYLGEKLKGVVEQTYLGGELVYEKGKFEKPSGKILLNKA